ncbi:MAG: hypothetical protein WBB05_29295 [Mycolicibacterium fortuitum]|uniref:hypothetical protein n=1 Tax=Mycolicibacterium fortuitum TaxID=1766 RepID=UPI0022BA2DD6|nr:hypothetical protein [Mycolicibacterium fortuitum]WAY19773.1 hypothetical protein OF855_01150 [Mycolicibacterium fortuitum]
MRLLPLFLLAHAGGWDEMVMIAGPLIVIFGLMRKARSSQPPTEPEDPRNDVSGKEKQ